MAINKTIFTADRTTQKSEILAWLQANATDYFDQIAENSGNIECLLENGAKLTFYGSSTLKYTKAGIVTSKGLMIVGANSSTTDNILIVSKTNNEKTAISMFASSSSGSGRYFSFIDLDGDSDWSRIGNNLTVFSAPITSLSPVCFACGTYCEHVFLTPFTQFENTCIMQINSKKYAYGGYLALEE